ncbi:MAG: 2-oxoglutarate dehydrogenase, E2 component, dihydrolipoamide succinyltransferase [Actinomycetota bacterium]|nr:2-oxoglutarate dehydrogenase, E2 component, dihydrolipoamide succinyltransferase [Actinomycetota bacterium]
MSERVTMPALGESVTEGTVTRWLKQVGEQVELDEPLLEVSTDKVDTEIPSPVAGTVQEILVQEDETVEVGADLAVIGEGAAPKSDDNASDADDAAAEPSAAAEMDQQNTQDPTDSEDSADAGSGSSSDDAEAQTTSETATDQADRTTSSDTGDSSGDGDGDDETVTMPALGESVTEGTVTRWLKAEGDQVEVDEPLLEVSTDKVDTEVPSPAAGTLRKILVAEDQTVEVGTALAVIGGSSSDAAGTSDTDSSQSHEAKDAPAAVPEEAAPEPAKPAAAVQKAAPKTDTPSAKAEPAASTTTESKTASDQSEGSDQNIYVTPLVRKLAGQHQVDLSSIKGTGIGGRIRKQDVLDAAESAKADAAAAAKKSEPASTPAPSTAQESSTGSKASSVPDVSAKRGTTEKMTRMRRLIATRMVESLQVSAQLTTVVEVDVTKIARLRDRAKAGFADREGVKLSFLPFFALAAVDALKAHPVLNASVEGDSIVYHPAENLGIAVDTEKGLFVPVIRNAGDLNIAGLARKIGDLAARTRDNKVTPDELGGGTFTLTNTGSRGALFDTPIINQPQVGILGTGSVVKRAVVGKDADGGENIAIRSMVYLALSYDHRIVDGADAARFLGTMKARLEDGAFDV